MRVGDPRGFFLSLRLSLIVVVVCVTLLCLAHRLVTQINVTTSSLPNVNTCRFAGGCPRPACPSLVDHHVLMRVCDSRGFMKIDQKPTQARAREWVNRVTL